MFRQGMLRRRVSPRNVAFVCFGAFVSARLFRRVCFGLINSLRATCEGRRAKRSGCYRETSVADVGVRIAYLVNQYPSVSHSFIRREIAALEAQGFEVERISIRPPPATLVDPADLAESKRTRVLLAGGPLPLVAAWVAAAGAGLGRWLTVLRAAIRLGRRSDRGVARHLIYMAEACRLLRWLRARGGVGHLHAHFGTNPAAVAMFARMLGGPRYSFTAHGPEEFDHPRELSLGEKIAHASAVVAVSDFGRSQLYRWTPWEDWSKVHVVRCGVDAPFLQAGPQPPAGGNRLVCVGRLVPEKGQLLIVDALVALAEEGVSVEMVFAGDGPLRAVIEERLRASGLGHKVRITGWVSNDGVRAELLSARAMVLPSFAEGLPVVLMEALALGRPAITTYVAGIPELVRDKVSGWLIPAGSLAALTGAIKAALAAAPAELGAMGRAGAAAVAERHDAAREAARLATIFGVRGEARADALETTQPVVMKQTAV
jgi:colanic acid/amylovoran biosynthesis glycosyltransferase